MNIYVRIFSLAFIATGAFGTSFIFENVLNSDALLTVPELLNKYEYPCEIHNITTKDGYILKSYRIPYGKKCGIDDAKNRPVVILMHGVLSSAYTYLQLGQDNALGYLLADNCFDVWLGNSRGNFESNQHVTLNDSNKEYWEFSWHEMGVYDLPATIDYILRKTNHSQLHYIGHSQGAAQFFVYASLNPEDSAKKIRSMHALAPICYLGENTSPGTYISAKYLLKGMEKLFELGLKGILYHDSSLVGFISKRCRGKPGSMKYLCAKVLFSHGGHDWENTNATAWISGEGHFPAGSSFKQFLHFYQIAKSGGFHMYDYGPKKNIKLYGSEIPPEYPLEVIKVPMYFHIGNKDRLATPKDSNHFAQINPNVHVALVDAPIFNHFDFTMSTKVKEQLYDKIIDQLKKDSVGMK